MFTDSDRRHVWDQIRQFDLRAFEKFLTLDLFTQAASRAHAKIGKNPLCLVNLVWLGVASAIHRADSFASVLVLTVKLLSDMEGFKKTPIGKAKQKGAQRKRRCKKKDRRSKHDPRRDDPTSVTEEAFAKARKAMPMDYWMALLFLLVERFEAEHGEQMMWHGYRLLAIDGTTVNLYRDKRLVNHFGIPKNQAKNPVQAPQARMVLLQSPTTRVPIDYRVGGLQTSEKTLADPLMENLRPRDLVLLDRGFWSYGLFCKMQQRQSYFVIRYFNSAKFKTIRRLGKDDHLVRWSPSDRKWRAAGLPTTISLRTVDYQIKGYRPSKLVTNLLDPNEVPRADLIGVSAEEVGLYHRRWQIETTYSELKVHQGMDNLRSRTPQGVRYEIAGHILLYLLVRWLMLEAALAHGKDPLQLSFRNACREIDHMAYALQTSSIRHIRRVLLPRLLERIAAHEVPQRPGRHYPRPGDTKIKNKGNGIKQLPSKLAA